MSPVLGKFKKNPKEQTSSYVRKFDIFLHTFSIEVLVVADPSVSEGALPAHKHSPCFYSLKLNISSWEPKKGFPSSFT